jgi:hypothetical protein
MLKMKQQERFMRRCSPGLIIGLLVAQLSMAQNGYYISQRVTLPSTFQFGPVTDLPMAVNREDVKAIGMGRAQVAMGTTFMALSYNPALLTHERFTIDVPSVEASLPTQTYDAILYLQNHRAQFENAVFLSDVQAGIDAYEAATSDPQRITALIQIEQGLKFPRDLLAGVIGTSSNPTTHGVLVIPAVVAQFGHWGFSVHANIQSGFTIVQSATLEALADVTIPQDLGNSTEVKRAVTQLSEIIKSVSLPGGGYALEEALPKAYAISYVDIVGTIGYGRKVSPRLSLGGALKVINRRFSTKRISADSFDEILSEVRKDFQTTVTGVTADIGALYTIPAWNTDIGVSVQNVVPFKGIRSSMTGKFTTTRFDYVRDGNGQIVLSGKGDTAVVVSEQKVGVEDPFELKLPVIVNVGAHRAITPEWDVAFDIVDLAARDARYERYGERIRMGTEYRLQTLDNSLGITPRIGMADMQLTLGVGLNILRMLQIDAAYAHDSYVDARSYFLQARLGW